VAPRKGLYNLTVIHQLQSEIGLVRVPTPPGKSGILFFKIPGPGKSWKITLVLESPGKISVKIMHLGISVVNFGVSSSTRFQIFRALLGELTVLPQTP